MLSLSVSASKKYKITIARDYSYFSKDIIPIISGRKIAVICDENAYNLYGQDFLTNLNGEKVYTYIVKSGENSKDLENFGKLQNSLANDGFTRGDVVITFGGGVVGDLGAFVSSTYMRGIKLVAVPTTLLSMIDSSVGGKTAINLDKGKNLCGTFYQPNAVYINLGLLGTLNKEQLYSGLGEVVKYSYLAGGDKIKADGKITEKLVYDCLKIKAKIVHDDEKESGERKFLNFGHTVGHAIEKLSNFTVPHGICVAHGIKYALNISCVYFGIDKNEFADLYKRLDIFNIKENQYTPKEIANIIKFDKKNDGTSIDFVLINKDRVTQIVKIPFTEVESLIEKSENI